MCLCKIYVRIEANCSQRERGAQGAAQTSIACRAPGQGGLRRLRGNENIIGTRLVSGQHCNNKSMPELNCVFVKHARTNDGPNFHVSGISRSFPAVGGIRTSGLQRLRAV